MVQVHRWEWILSEMLWYYCRCDTCVKEPIPRQCAVPSFVDAKHAYRKTLSCRHPLEHTDSSNIPPGERSCNVWPHHWSATCCANHNDFTIPDMTEGRKSCSVTMAWRGLDQSHGKSLIEADNFAMDAYEKQCQRWSAGCGAPICPLFLSWSLLCIWWTDIWASALLYPQQKSRRYDPFR